MCNLSTLVFLMLVTDASLKSLRNQLTSLSIAGRYVRVYQTRACTLAHLHTYAHIRTRSLAANVGLVIYTAHAAVAAALVSNGHVPAYVLVMVDTSTLRLVKDGHHLQIVFPAQVCSGVLIDPMESGLWLIPFATEQSLPFQTEPMA